MRKLGHGRIQDADSVDILRQTIVPNADNENVDIVRNPNPKTLYLMDVFNCRKSLTDVFQSVSIPTMAWRQIALHYLVIQI